MSAEQSPMSPLLVVIVTFGLFFVVRASLAPGFSIASPVRTRAASPARTADAGGHK